MLPSKKAHLIKKPNTSRGIIFLFEALQKLGKVSLSLILCRIPVSLKISTSSRGLLASIFNTIYFPGMTAMNNGSADFESASPAIVKSIKQRDLLNVWLRLYAKHERLPKFEDYLPERFADESADLVHYIVQGMGDTLRFVIDSDGTRMSNAYGTTGKGRYLDEYLGAKLAPVIIPIYHECIHRQLPVFTISQVNDLYGRKVDYERLLMPFSDGAGVNRIIASLKTISDDGGFEIRNLMRANDVLPIYQLRSVIDRDLFHKKPGRITPGDAIEFV